MIISVELAIAIKYLILVIFQKFKMESKVDLINFIFLVKLIYNKRHLHGLNWIFVEKVKWFKIHDMEIRFYYLFSNEGPKLSPMVDISHACVV